MSPVGVVAALPVEARALAGRRSASNGVIELSPELWLCIGGVGGACARRAAEMHIAAGAGALVSWGCAGALAPRLCPGTLVIPHTVVTPGGEVYGVDAAWRTRLSARLDGTLEYVDGAVAASPGVVADAGAKQRLHASTRCVAVDMESGAIAQVAGRSGAALLVVRAIADPASAAIPRAAVAGVDTHGKLKPLAFGRELARHPSDALAILRLWMQLRSACAALARAGVVGGPALCWPPPSST